MSNRDETMTGISDEAVCRATGRGWDDWLALLDGLGAGAMDHKQIVALIAGPGEVSSGWWQQSVAVGYERARGMRVVGQTSDAGFQVGVQKTLPVSPGEAWRLITEEPGRHIWLGTSEPLEFRKGEQYRTAEGSWGEVRSAVPGQRVRLTWCRAELQQPTTLQVYIVAAGEKTSVRFHHERLSSLEERELLREHWRGVLDSLINLVAS